MLSPLNMGALVLVIVCWCIFSFMYLFLRAYDSHHCMRPNRKTKVKNNSFHMLHVFVWTSVVIQLVYLAMEPKHLFEFSTFFKWWFQDPAVYNPLSAVCIVGSCFLVCYGLMMVVRGRIALDGFWGPEIYTYEPDGNALKQYVLIKDGVYHYMRHPIYFGQIIMAVFSSLALNSWPMFIFSVMLILSNRRRYKKEDADLAETFGEEWEVWEKERYPYHYMPFKIPKAESEFQNNNNKKITEDHG